MIEAIGHWGYAELALLGVVAAIAVAVLGLCWTGKGARGDGR